MQNSLPRKLFPFIWHFLYPYRWVMILFVSIAACSGLWGVFNNIFIKQVIDLLPEAENGDISVLIFPGAMIVINFIVLDNFTWRSIGYLDYKYQGKMKNQIITSTLHHILSESHQFFQDNFSGRISNQVTRLADNIEVILFRVSVDFIRGIFLLIASFVTSFIVNPIFCYIQIVWFLCFAGFSIWMSRKLVALSGQLAETEAVVSGQIVDVVTNHSNVRIFARKSFELIRIDKFLKKMQKAFQKTEMFIIILYSIQGAMIAAMIGGSCYFLIILYKLKLVNVGDFSLILGLSVQLGHMMWYTMSRVDDFNKAYGKSKESLASLIRYPEVQDQSDAKVLICDKGQIVFKDVKFQYKDSDPLFQKKSITIKSGQKVGLVGYSGGGKTTFVNLILRLYDITEGSILIDGQDIKNITQDSLRDAIAIIPQDPSLFHRSLMDNIRYGNAHASDEQVIQAAKEAHAHEFISLLPQGYDSLVGERGIKLSGGQRQRIAIARAILKNAPILILDEATSQLDSVTENLIQDSLWHLMRNKTTLVVAHRLSTLLHMDRILVFDKGKIVEDGTHADLLTRKGLYNTLWEAQVGGFLGDE